MNFLKKIIQNNIQVWSTFFCLILGIFVLFYTILIDKTNSLKIQAELLNTTKSNTLKNIFLIKNYKEDYQKFIEPENEKIINLAKNKSVEELYYLVSDFYWISDKVLNNQENRWLKIDAFLTTDSWKSNPTHKIASDCEEKVYTLVSLFRNKGVVAEKIRMVIGDIFLENKIITHAWVEIYLDQFEKWLVLDPSNGNYWDENQQKLVEKKPLNFDFYLNHTYPVSKIYHIFNDQYIWDSNFY